MTEKEKKAVEAFAKEQVSDTGFVCSNRLENGILQYEEGLRAGIIFGAKFLDKLRLEEPKTKNKEILELYNLEIHQSMTLPSGITIIRVPSGWLYDGKFVPYSNAFYNEELYSEANE